MRRASRRRSTAAACSSRTAALSRKRSRRRCAMLHLATPCQHAAPALFLGGVALLVLVLIPGFGREVNGARRWLELPLFSVQPSELMKLAAVLYAADYTTRKHGVLKKFRRGLLPILAV